MPILQNKLDRGRAGVPYALPKRALALALALSFACAGGAPRAAADSFDMGESASESTDAESAQGRVADSVWRARRMGPAVAYLPSARFRRFFPEGDGFDAEAARQWAILVELLQHQPMHNKLMLVQKFFSTLPYRSDAEVFGVADYWAGAGDVLRRGGDCEDHALAKYRLLADAGVPPESMRMVLAEDTTSGEEHAYLLVEAERPDQPAYVLDNRFDQVVTEKYVSNYRPLYAVNRLSAWAYAPAEAGAPEPFGPPLPAVNGVQTAAGR